MSTIHKKYYIFKIKLDYCILFDHFIIQHILTKL